MDACAEVGLSFLCSLGPYPVGWCALPSRVGSLNSINIIQLASHRHAQRHMSYPSYHHQVADQW